MTPSVLCTKKGVLWLSAAMVKDMTAFSPSSASVAYNKYCDLSLLMATYSVCVMSVSTYDKRLEIVTNHCIHEYNLDTRHH